MFTRPPAAFAAVLFPPWTFGAFWLGVALALAAQTAITLRRGFVFRDNFRRVHRHAEPGRFRFWLGVQLFLILVALALAIQGLRVLR